MRDFIALAVARTGDAQRTFSFQLPRVHFFFPFVALLASPLLRHGAVELVRSTENKQ